MPFLILLSVLGVFALTFAVTLFFVRSSKIEAALQRQLDRITETYRHRSIATTILREERFSPSPQINDLLARTPMAGPLLRLIKQAGMSWWVSSVVGYSLACAVGGGLLSAIVTGGVVIPLLSAVALGFAPTGYLMIMRGQRFAQCAKILPDAVDLMARSLRAGHALNSALEMVSSDIAEPLSSEFRTVYEEQSLGLPLRDALTNLLQRIPSPDLEFLAAALLLQKETGGNLAQILDKTSSLMRDRVRLRGQIRTHTAQARVSGWVLGVLPFVMFVLMNLINPGYESILLNDPIGVKLIYAGFVMLGVGALIIRKIVDIQI